MAILELRDVSKFYNTSGTVALGLRHVNLTFNAGEFVAITGESGSGKTTLLNVLSGLDGFDEGEFLVCGKETGYCSEQERETYRNNLVSYIFQDYSIIDSYTVYQNVELALLNSIRNKSERHERVMEILRRVGLESHAKHRGTKLSGGQKQRVSIARALAKDAPILFADEPTGNLDSRTGAEIMALLNELSGEKLVIVVTHNYEDLQGYATRRIRLFDGQIIEDKILNEGELPPAVAERFSTIHALSERDIPAEIIERYSSAVAFFNAPDYSSAATDSGIDKKEARKQRFQEAMYSLKEMLYIGSNNLKSTPRRTFFSFTGMILLALAIIFACNTFFSANTSEDMRANNFTYYYANKDSITIRKTDGYFSQQDIDSLLDDNKIQCVLNSDETYHQYVNSVNLSQYLEYKEGGIISYNSTDSLYFECHCAHDLSSRLADGRLPTAAGEIVLALTPNPTRNDLLDKTITLVDPLNESTISPESYYVTRNFEGYLPRHEYKIVGIVYDTDPKMYFYHGDYVLLSDSEYNPLDPAPIAEGDVVANGSKNLSQVIVKFDTKRHKATAVLSDLRQKGYKAYYPFGLQSRNMTLQLILGIMMITGVAIVLLLVLAISSGAQRSVSDLKRREYAIMRSVGIKGSMLSKMYLTEQWILAFFAHIVAGIIFLVIQMIIILIAKRNGVQITSAYIADILRPFYKAFLLGYALTMLFAAWIVRRFNKKFYNATVKTALTETEAIV